MATTKRARDRKKDSTGASAGRRRLEERRFKPARARMSWTAFGAGGAGALAAGLGVYARFLAAPAYPWAVWLLALGVGVLAAAMLFGSSATPVRVGDVGVAVEKGSEVVRLTWAALDTIEIRGDQLFLASRELKIGIPLSAHQHAAAWILSEGTRRMPEVMNVKASVADQLPKPRKEDGELMRIEDLQLAGKKCKKSGKTISYEGDARLCPNCAELYHRNSVPKTCVTCEQPLGEKAIAI